MNRTFLITIDLPIEVDPALIADEIFEELDLAFEVISVKPWSDHSTSALTPPPVEGSEFLGQDS